MTYWLPGEKIKALKALEWHLTWEPVDNLKSKTILDEQAKGQTSSGVNWFRDELTQQGDVHRLCVDYVYLATIILCISAPMESAIDNFNEKEEYFCDRCPNPV